MAISALASLISASVCAAPVSLVEQFRTPPPETRPWIYWYWVNNHISREGITRDLEAMKSFGIGTAFIGNPHFPDLPDGPVPILGEEWFELTTHAIREGRRLGIDIGLFNAAGWSQSGGPWIASNQTMRFLNWSETRVAGGETFTGVLPVPREPFQDVAVLAVPVSPEDRATLSGLSPQVEAPDAPDPVGNLVDDDRTTIMRFPAGARAWTITVAVDRLFTARSLTLYPSRADFRMQVALEAEQPDGTFRPVRNFSFDRSNNRLEVGPVPFAPVSISFPETTASRWRLVLTGIASRDPNAGLAEIELSGAARVERVMEKQLAKLHPTPKPLWDAYLWSPVAEPSARGLVTDPAGVVDLSGHMQEDGQLLWRAPPGDWVILRVGMSPTGVTNHPAAPNASGPEVDKMNRQALRHHFDSFIGRVLARLTPDEKTAFKYVVADSYETGSENWTDGFGKLFAQRYGYDPKPWLPVLTGRVVGSADRSDRFLWDLRRLVADQVASNYVGGLRELAHEHGMKVWLENYGHWGFPAEFLQYGGQADLLGGEFWIGNALGDIECRAAASAAHIYGQPIAYVEAFTSGRVFEYYPYALKARGDWAFTEGVNHFVLHVYIGQPDDAHIPGINTWFGTEFNRHNTWFAAGTAWVDYLRRCQLLLQQGRNVANIAYFIGEDTPKMTGSVQPSIPPGYAYDFINAEVILQRLAVRDGRFVLPDGTSYDLIVLPDQGTMRPAVLAKLRDLVFAGGAILGTAPTRSPSLEDYPAADGEVQQIAAELWRNDDPQPVGLGYVFPGHDLSGALAHLGIGPDVSGTDPAKILWTHRSSENREIYFISNQTDENVALSPVFRTIQRAPELWHPVSGDVSASARGAAEVGGTRVDFSLGPRGSVFVVFPKDSAVVVPGIVAVTRDGEHDETTVVVRDGSKLVARVAQNGDYRFIPETGQALSATVCNLPAPITMTGLWTVRFPPHMDLPATITLPKLISWTEHANEAVRHFSGTADYESTFTVPAGLIASDRRFLLELGRVEVIAEVSLNGRTLGTAWLPPYQLDVTTALQPGENRLSIKVTNLWRNRVVGDLKYPAGYPDGPRPKEFQTQLLTERNLPKDQPLQPSGLLGPVRLVTEQNVALARP